jgi:hypothetical protein
MIIKFNNLIYLLLLVLLNTLDIKNKIKIVQSNEDHP